VYEINKTKFPININLLAEAMVAQRKLQNFTAEKVCEILTILESCNEDSEYDGLNNVLKNLFDIY
jgi:hypothetical protein